MFALTIVAASPRDALGPNHLQGCFGKNACHHSWWENISPGRERGQISVASTQTLKRSTQQEMPSFRDEKSQGLETALVIDLVDEMGDKVRDLFPFAIRLGWSGSEMPVLGETETPDLLLGFR